MAGPRLLLALAATLALALGAAAATGYELIVVDPSLERVVGYGTFAGTEFKLVVNAYNGPVKAFWVSDGSPPVLKSYSGTLANGQLRLTQKGTVQPLEVGAFLAARGVARRVSLTVVRSQAEVGPTARPASPPAAAPAPKPATPRAPAAATPQPQKPQTAGPVPAPAQAEPKPTATPKAPVAAPKPAPSKPAAPEAPAGGKEKP